MQIFSHGKTVEDPGTYPSLTLLEDSWDDYAFKTSFYVSLWVSKGESIGLSTVKIMKMGQRQGRTELNWHYPSGLTDEYASLGSDLDYYEQVRAHGILGEDILQSLNDVAIDPARYERFSNEHGFVASLHRLAPAQDALRQMRRMLSPAERDTFHDPDTAKVEDVAPDVDPAQGASSHLPHSSPTAGPATIEAKTDSLALEFSPSRAGRHLVPSPIRFDFSGPALLPSRLIALVGPNGTGKTTLLADLALDLFFGGGEDASRQLINYISGSVRDIIFISYSAYDSFEVPHGQELEPDARSDLARQGYVYVGLRKLEADTEASEDPFEREHRLKSIREIDREFADILEKLTAAGNDGLEAGKARVELFSRSVKELFEDPSLAALARFKKARTAASVIKSVAKLFPHLSTGHKAILNIVASLCLRLNQNSLVLMDEPEAHLHPPLISSLLKVVRGLLEEFQANAIVATHSPVVVQETLAAHVLVLRRDDDRTSWRYSASQTFGENIAALTRETFGLPAAQADYIARLRQLVEAGLPIEAIEGRFAPLGMSSPARAQAIRLITEKELGKRK